jgi:hypothetical protein
MQTPQASVPQQPISVSGRIVIEGRLSPPNIASPPETPIYSSPWWQFWRKPPEIVATVILAVATIILAGATIFLAIIAWKQADIAKNTDISLATSAQWQERSELRQTLLAYLTAYGAVSREDNGKGIDAISHVSCYKHMANMQSPVQTLDGLLITVVDEMYDIGDKRAETWAKYIPGIPGPLATGYPLAETYATNQKTKDAIKHAKDLIDKMPPENTCPDTGASKPTQR